MPGHEKDYNNWLRPYLIFERKAPGYLNMIIILPGGSTLLCCIYYLVLYQ